MKKLFLSILALAFVSVATAGTVPLYLSGDAGASYVVSASAIVTTTNTSVLYTNATIGITNEIDGALADTLAVSWRGTETTYTFTNSATESTHIATSSNLTNQLFNIFNKLQGDYGYARVRDYNQSTFTISSPTYDRLIVTYAGTNLTVAKSSYYDTQDATQTVLLRANPVTLTTNTIIYVSSITTNGAGAVTALVLSTNRFVTSQ